MKSKLFIFFTFLGFFNSGVLASSFDYIYPNQKPMFSNYGTVGLLSNPSARFHEEGTIGFTWNRMQPYFRGSIIAYPFSWFEASYQYVDINNELYSDIFEFSGNQSLKDKSFDGKFRLLKETNILPALALGFRDAAGTGLFSSEYLVGSKQFNNFDITLGIGWGMLSNNSIRNPLGYINDSFDGEREATKGTEGGEFSFDRFFRGEAGIFGGIEYRLPYLNGARIVIEKDGVDYSKEGYSRVKQKDDINFGFVYPVTNNFQLKLGYVRGNTLNIGFSYVGNYSNKNPFFKKNDPPKPIPKNKADLIKIINKDNDRYIYRTALKNLADNQIYLQSANIADDRKSIKVAYSQAKFMSYPQVTGRASMILDQILPENFSTFELIHLNANLGSHSIEIDRSKYIRYKDNNLPNTVIQKENIKNIKYRSKDFAFNPKAELPEFLYRFGPALRTQIGGPDGFFFGDIRLAFIGEYIVKKNLTITASASQGIFNNMAELKLGSDSVLPHVRSDIVKYLKQSQDFAIDNLKINYFMQPRKDLFTKITAGYLEQMFGGIGSEVLYRPIDKNWAVGAEVWDVQRRKFNGFFGFKDYRTITGHLNFLYFEPNSGVLFSSKFGKFLAKDSGVHVNFARIFDNGARIGAFATVTDVSREEFGEGSFDKGFYFFIPIQSFFTNYSTGYTGFGLRPITRDGGAMISNEFDLWGVTHSGSYYNHLKNWDDLYD